MASENDFHVEFVPSAALTSTPVGLGELTYNILNPWTCFTAGVPPLMVRHPPAPYGLPAELFWYKANMTGSHFSAVFALGS